MRHRHVLPALAALAALARLTPAAPHPTTPVRRPTTSRRRRGDHAGEGRRDRRHAPGRHPGGRASCGSRRASASRRWSSSTPTTRPSSASTPTSARRSARCSASSSSSTNTNFDGIIGGLDADRYDLALTSMIDKKERQESVDFVDYLNSGLAFMTLKDNPEGLTDRGGPVRRGGGGREGGDRRPRRRRPERRLREERRRAARQAAVPRPGQRRAGPASRAVRTPCSRST